MAASSSGEPRRVSWESWVPDIHATLIFVVQGDQILLIEKLRGIGEGKINGPGGKIDPGESSIQAALREADEELHIQINDAIKCGELWFAMSDIPDIHCHVFVASAFTGTPTATDEAIPRWTSINEIPYDRMWADDKYWLPAMLRGENFDARFVFEGERIVYDEVIFNDQSRWRGDPRAEEISPNQ